MDDSVIAEFPWYCGRASSNRHENPLRL